MSINIINSQGVELWIANINPPADITCDELYAGILGGTQIDCPQSLGELAETRDVTEYKCLSSGDSAKALGAITIGSFEVSVLHDPSNPSSGQNLLRAAFANNTQFYMGVKLPDADETMYIFKAGVSAQNVTVEQDAAIMGNYTIEIASEIRECGKVTPLKPFKVLVHAPSQAEALPAMFTGPSADVPYDPTTISTASVVDNGDGSYLITSDDAITGIHWHQNTAVTAIDMQAGKDLIKVVQFAGNASLCNGCTGLISFKVSAPMPLITNIQYAWLGCSSLTSFDMSGLTDVFLISNAWSGCSSLTSFDTSPLTSITSVTGCWDGCSSLTSFDASPLTAVTNIGSAWRGCSSLTSFDTSPLTAVTTATGAWNGCTGLTSFDTSGLAAAPTINSAWKGCTGLTSFDTSLLKAATNVISSWENCSGLTSFDASGLTSVQSVRTAWINCTELLCISSVLAPDCVDVTNAFYNTPKLVHPDAAEQAAHFTTTGIDWTNPTACA